MPITRTSTFMGRRAAALTITPRSCGERGALTGTFGLRSGAGTSGILSAQQPDPGPELQAERLGGGGPTKEAGIAMKVTCSPTKEVGGPTEYAIRPTRQARCLTEDA